MLVKAYLSFGFLLRLLGQKYSLDVGKNISLCDGDTGKQFVQLLVITESQLNLTGVILVILLSRAALPANSRISALKYSRTAAK